MKKYTCILVFVCLTAVQVGCNFPATNPFSTEPTLASSPDAVATSLPVQTITPQPATPLPQETHYLPHTTPSATGSLPSTAQPLASQAVSQSCDRASAGKPIDITVPDNTIFEPGQSFTKTWRLLNASSCTWTSDYAAVWFSGETFGAPVTAILPGIVPPGKPVDITMDMVAPQKPGTYQSNWKLQNPDGELFGIGPNGDAPFWVRIIVTQPEQMTGDNTATTTPSPLVYASGIANLTLNDSLDLDQVKINQGKADDIIYNQDRQHHLQLVAINGALLAQSGKSQPSISDCQAAELSTNPVPLDGVASGMYFCYKTNMGLPGWARLVYLNPKDNVLTIEILTWSTP